MFELYSDKYEVTTLTPEHFVSATGTIDRDLWKDDFRTKYEDDTAFEELKGMLRKNFCDEASFKRVMERLAWAILNGKPNSSKWWLELMGPADGGRPPCLSH